MLVEQQDAGCRQNLIDGARFCCCWTIIIFIIVLMIGPHDRADYDRHAHRRHPDDEGDTPVLSRDMSNRFHNLWLPTRVSIGYTAAMRKDSGFRIRVDRELRDRFLNVCRAQDRPAAQIIREFMREYVSNNPASPNRLKLLSQIRRRRARR